MKRIAILFVLGIAMFLGTHAVYDEMPRSFQIIISSACAQEAEGSASVQQQIGNPLLQWGICLSGFAVIWVIFYFLMYPFLLNYYSPDYCKALFWSIVLLYFIAWISINFYVIFEIGFIYDWSKWVFAFLGAMWLIWLMIVLFKKDNAY